MMLRPEEVGWRQDIGAVALLEGDPLCGTDGEVDLERVRSMIAGRLHLVPRFRQVLRSPPWWLGRPLWVDAADLRVENHVRVAPLRPEATESDLLVEVERLRARPFDRTRPLWEVWLLPRLADGRVGLYVKLHHTIADGIAGIALLGALLDMEPDVAPPPARPWAPTEAPTTGELFADHLRRTADVLIAALAAVTHPVASLRHLVATAKLMRQIFGQDPVPLISVNRPIGDDRLVALVRSELELFKTIGHAHRATVNDVLLAAVSGGYRSLLTSRGDPVEDLMLRASVPASLRSDETAAEPGNDVGMMFAPLPVGIEDPAQRLEVIASATAELRRTARRAPSGPLLDTRFMQLTLLRKMDHQRWSNGYVADVPGPPIPLFLAGARLTEVFAIVPIMGNLTIGVGAISYDGEFNITVVADRSTCPDVEVFANGIRATLDELRANVRVG